MSKLYLFPNVLDPEDKEGSSLPLCLATLVPQIEGLIAESEKEGRRFLRRFQFPIPKSFRDIPIRLLNEHTPSSDLEGLLTPILDGQSWGLISDCGMPCLADPGKDLVFKARQRGVIVQAVAGSSAILLALVSSGLEAQRFAFHGYLPKEEASLLRTLSQMEERSRKEKATQLFIETPYRNEKLFAFLINSLNVNTLLCVATDLTMPSEEVITLPIKEWKKRSKAQIQKRYTIFLIYSPL